MSVLEIVLFIAGALGIRELLAIFIRNRLNKNKTDAEVEGMHLSNTEQEVKTIRELMYLSDELLTKSQHQFEQIQELNKTIVTANQKISHKDSIIQYQKEEIATLYADNAKLQVRVEELERRVGELEVHNKLLITENLQAKALIQNQNES